MAAMSAVVFLTSDLMFSSQVLGAASALGLAVQLVARPDITGKLSDDCRLVLIDLTLTDLVLPEVAATIRAVAPHAQIVAFGPHVDERALAAAEAAGADLVLSRGQFHKQYAALLREISEQRASAGERGA
jgi:DNA-binding NarL/FixJ family response regulator